MRRSCVRVLLAVLGFDFVFVVYCLVTQDNYTQPGFCLYMCSPSHLPKQRENVLPTVIGCTASRRSLANTAEPYEKNERIAMRLLPHTLRRKVYIQQAPRLGPGTSLSPTRFLL